MAQDTTPAIVVYQGDGANNVFSVPMDKGFYGEIFVPYVRRGRTDYDYDPKTFSLITDDNGVVTSVVWEGEPLNEGDFICIARKTDSGQPFEYQNNQKHIEKALDNLSRQIQEVRAGLATALKVDASFLVDDPAKMNPIDWLQSIVRSKDMTARGLRFNDAGFLQYSLDDPDIADEDKTWTNLVATDNIQRIRQIVRENPRRVVFEYYVAGVPYEFDFHLLESQYEGIKAIAERAEENSNTAIKTANRAIVDSAAAVNTANGTIAIANEAIDTAARAEATAAVANQNAGDALNIVTEANATANNANVLSNQAVAGANNAITIATRAEGKADNAIQVANAAAARVAGVYLFKGSKPTYVDLPLTGNQIGDVWDIADTGKNYAWTGTAWDDLGGTVDLSVFYTKDEMDTTVDAINTEIETLSNDLGELGDQVHGVEEKIPASASASNQLATQADLQNIDALPSQAGNAGKVLTTNGTTASWEDRPSGGGNALRITIWED